MDVDLKQKVWEFRVRFETTTDDDAMLHLSQMCEGVVRSNMLWMNNEAPGAPCCLGTAGVRYVLPSGCKGRNIPCQTVRGAAEILDSREATCIDISCYMAAVLRLRDQRARVYFQNMVRKGRSIPGQYHVLVETNEGILDFTQALIAGDVASCSVSCSPGFQQTDPAYFDPSEVLPE